MLWKLNEYSSSLAILALLFSVIFTLVFFILPLLGHALIIGSIHPSSLQHVRYVRAKLYSISISSLRLALHFPSPREPYWAKFIAQDYHYQDSKCAVSSSKIEGTLWFFPMLFRFTAGPLLTLNFDGFRLQVHESECTPRWVRQLRDNLIYTAINEETVRLHQFKPRFVLSGLMGMTGYIKGSNEIDKPGSESDQELDEVKIQGKAQQWHIHNVQNNRMYTFDAVRMELRESWVDDRRTLIMIAHDSKWTKLPLVGHCFNGSWLRYVGQAVVRAPRELIKMIKDPLSVINIDVSRCDIIFGKFHLKDSALVEQGSVLIRQNYEKSKHHGILSDACIDNFIEALSLVYDRQQEDQASGP